MTLLKGAHSTYDVGAVPAADVEKEVEKLILGRGGRVLDWEGVVAFWDGGDGTRLSLSGCSE